LASILRAVEKKANQVVKASTTKYSKLMAKAAKAANETTRAQYISAALTALMVVGIAAGEVKARMDHTKAIVPVKKKRAGKRGAS
jgi:hypothetical protein